MKVRRDGTKIKCRSRDAAEVGRWQPWQVEGAGRGSTRETRVKGYCRDILPPPAAIVVSEYIEHIEQNDDEQWHAEQPGDEAFHWDSPWLRYKDNAVQGRWFRRGMAKRC